VLEEAIPLHGGRWPDELRVTHPARWGEGRLAKLRAAAAFAGFDDPLLVPEPVGAAVYFATEQLLPGDHVAVYDLGGGTFDTAVLRRAEIGFEVVGEPGGRDDLGGEDFDDRLYRFLGRRLDPEQWQTLIAPDSGRSWQRAHYDFKKNARRAKEHLSRYPDATVRTPIPDGEDIQVSRAEFEGLIREDIESTIAELERTVEAAGHSVEDLAAIYLAGGSSRIPLIWHRIEQRIGKQPSTLGDPKAVIALGAARVPLRAGSKPATGNGADIVAVGGSPATPAIPRPPDTGEPAATTQERESLDRVSAVGAAVALLGSAVVILSEFLRRRYDKNLWQVHSSMYPIILAVLALLVILLVATGLRRGRPALLVVATFVAAFLTACVAPLMVSGYSQFQSGVWIGILGGVLPARTLGWLICVSVAIWPPFEPQVCWPASACSCSPVHCS
jgi:Hsp70 protein